MPTAWPGVSVRTLNAGKTRMSRGVSMAVQLIPVRMATLTVRTRAGNMNQSMTRSSQTDPLSVTSLCAS